MTGHHMAGHLEVVAELCREDNPAGMAAARSMLAHRQMLAALEADKATIADPNASVAERLAVRSVVQHAIAEATGDKS